VVNSWRCSDKGLLRSGNLYVISGPSGVGKGSILAEVFKRINDGWFSVSATTRAPRGEEVEGKDYFFVDNRKFDELIASQGLLEWAPVHAERYGTPRKAIEQHISQGMQVLLDIDVQGALQVKKAMPEAILIFIEPPSLEELERRLRGRETDSEEQIARRMSQASREISEKARYNYSVINDDLAHATDQVLSIIEAHASRKETTCP